MDFEQFQLNKKIMTGVRRAGFKTPTPVQKEAIPPILEGRDVLATAQTGTGKTAAFMLPILHRLMEKPAGSVRALIIAPTRELSEQSRQAGGLLGRSTGLRVMSIYGGVNIKPQIQNLKKGVDIVSACPGRLLDHLNRGTVSLDAVEVLVLDEADRMFDMGFLPDIKKIIRRLPRSRQTLLFSATMPPEIQSLAGSIMQDPVAVHIGRQAPAETVSQAFYAVESDDKITLLNDILQGSAATSVLVFTRTKHRATVLARRLEKRGVEAASLHGNLSQAKRQKALDGFRRSAYKVLVATDIAARGIDVEAISHVINYDMPDTAEAYTHRIGRTGRAEKTGEACSFITRQDSAIVRSLESSLGIPVNLSTFGSPGSDVCLSVKKDALFNPKPAFRSKRKRQSSGKKRFWIM